MKQQEVVKQATAGIIRDGEDSDSEEEDVNTRQSSSAVASKLNDGEAHNKLIQGIMNEEEKNEEKQEGRGREKRCRSRKKTRVGWNTYGPSREEEEEKERQEPFNGWRAEI